MANLLIIIVSAVFVNNFVVVQFLGICPFLGVSKKTESAFGMGVAVIFVMTVASLVCYCLYNYVLVPVGITYLKTIVFIFVIASLVQILEMVLKKFAPALYRSMGVYLPLITTNCAILGVAELNLTSAMVTNVLTATLNGFFSGIGFLLAIVLLSGVREKVDKMPIAKPLKGVPITMICSFFMAMAFYVFGTVAL